MLLPTLTSSSSSTTRALYLNYKESYHHNPESLVQTARVDRHQAVCIIENITPEWSETLKKEWDLDRNFFLNHTQNPPKEGLWNHVFGTVPHHVGMDNQKGGHHCSIDGVFEYNDWETTEGARLPTAPILMQRHWWEGPKPYPLSSNTRISYYRVNERLYLFLVDAPIILSEFCLPKRARPHPILRLPLSNSRGGVALPSLYQDVSYSFNLFDSLKSFFLHSWHFRVLFSEKIPETSVLRPGRLIYLLSASLWDTNLRFLQKEIKRISFDDILQPTVYTNEELHHNRRDLVLLRDGVIETRDYIPKDVVDWYESIDAAHEDMQIRTPSKTLERILVDEEKLSQFLMDSFQLLLSTLSTRDSQTSLEQATRGQRLTQLAFIYVPLSFVTGIYGMNLKEVNGSPLSIWVTVISAVVVIACTLGIFWLLPFFEGREAKRLVLSPARRLDDRVHVRLGLKLGRTSSSTEGLASREGKTIHAV